MQGFFLPLLLLADASGAGPVGPPASKRIEETAASETAAAAEAPH